MTPEEQLDEWLFVREIALARVDASLERMAAKAITDIQIEIAERLASLEVREEYNTRNVLKAIDTAVDDRMAELYEESQAELSEIAADERQESSDAYALLMLALLARESSHGYSVSQAERVQNSLSSVSGTPWGDELAAAQIDVDQMENSNHSGRNAVALAATIAILARTRNDDKGLKDSPLILGHTGENYLKEQTRSMKFKLRGIAKVSIAEGETASELIKRVSGTKTNGRKDSTIDIHKTQAGAILKTTSAGTVNDTREEVFDEFKIEPELVHKSILDGSTSHICLARAGVRWKSDKTPINHSFKFKKPPLHFNCRSRIVATFSRSKEGFETAEDWLKSVNDDVAKKVLGKWRYEQHKAGKLKIVDLVDQRDRPLTIKQLKKKSVFK